MHLRIFSQIFLAFLLVLVVIQFASSLEIDVEINPSFSTGEKISFNYSFISDVDQEISYFILVNCPQAPSPLLEMKNLSLYKNILFKDNYLFLSKIEDYVTSQKCNAIVSVISPTAIAANKTFLINARPSFEFELKTCKDELCNLQSRFFEIGERIYLNYSSNVNDLIIHSYLTFPEGENKEIDLPYSFDAEMVGNYQLFFNVSKEGHISVLDNIEFGIVNKEANIPYVNLSDEAKEKNMSNFLFYSIIICIIILIILFGAVFLKIGKKHFFT